MENQQISKGEKQRFFDLTTEEGKKEVLKFFFRPIPYLLTELYERMASSHQEGLKIQKRMAEDIIRCGRENGVDEMEIKINNRKGLKLNIPEDVKLETMIGTDDSMTLKVKYKNRPSIMELAENPE